ncbi:uncharacterized protein BYT42DRAFT_589650 [Radiomyces spectabilis]|uniref:uncharacterized protein n=1 Tax=Radiomyces spectabilis TaxID=64574 RepID=UPI00221EA9E0|nr:uncharacterized protein BYT42DRAFT_589650 [Radiomyces spectabilis]KAI8365361.1 hypothetical protein BYT42DRAFT_589650 [Radiomyces spectabilis]
MTFERSQDNHPTAYHHPHYPTMNPASLDTDVRLDPWPTESSLIDYDHVQAATATMTPPAVTTSASSLLARPKGSLSSSTAASPPLDPSKPSHPEWGVMKEQDFHPLTLKHQRDLENLFQSGASIADFYFWQANLGGYCMADMIQNMVISSEGVFVLVRRIVEGAPHPGRRKKKRTTN